MFTEIVPALGTSWKTSKTTRKSKTTKTKRSFPTKKTYG
jgi:hypothetical protein